MALVATIEESIGRVSDLVKAVKSYAYEGKGQKQSVDINESIHATLVILAHKFRERQIIVEKTFTPNLPPLECECSGLNQVWTNLLDNALDAVQPNGHIAIRTWQEETPSDGADPRPPIPLRLHRRRRPRHPPREPAPHLRPLLHHQGSRRRHRPRPRHRPAHRRAVPRHRHLLLRPRQHRIPHPPPPKKIVILSTAKDLLLPGAPSKLRLGGKWRHKVGAPSKLCLGGIAPPTRVPHVRQLHRLTWEYHPSSTIPLTKNKHLF